MDCSNVNGDNQRQVTFVEAVKMGFDKYVCFKGRASRSEYWWWYLFSAIVGWVAAGIDAALDINVISIIALIGLLLPNLGIACRRLHDIGKAAGWIFISLIPIVGAIILIVWFVKPSEGANRFGDVPNLV